VIDEVTCMSAGADSSLLGRQIERLTAEVADLRRDMKALTALATRLDRSMAAMQKQMRATCDQLTRMNEDRF
jgi:hypothetical protein